jgi:dienelactone hydrolase
VAAVVGATVLVLAAVGAVLAPTWERPELPADRRFDGLPETATPPDPPESGTPIQRTEVSVPVGDTTLSGTVISPGSPGPHPAIVYVHGGGTGSRAGYVALAERMARAGHVGLVYDKRTVGYDFLRRDYGQLADDALAMVRLLRERSDVDQARVGLWGISEGGWVVPIAAGRGDEVGFAILAAAPNISPGVQVSWAVDDGLQRLGAPAGARRLVSRALAVGGTEYVAHDPVPPLRQVRQPVLALYGTEDRAVPQADSARILADTLDAAGNRSYTIRFVPGADHSLRVNGTFAPGYVATMAAWLDGLPRSGQSGASTGPGSTAEPRVAGLSPVREPVQRYAAVSQPAGLVGMPLLLTAFGAVTAGYLAGPAVAVLTRRRRRGTAPDPTWLRLRPGVRRMTAVGAGTAVGMNVVIGGLVALAYAGGPSAAAPVAWAALRLAAVGMVVVTAATGVAVTGALRAGWRPSGPARVSLVGASGATGLVLLLGAYWELFAPRW